MKITLKNKEIIPAINFLQKMELSANKDSRHRSKLVSKLQDAFKEFSDDEKELMQVNNLLTEEGTLKTEDQRNVEDVAAFNRDQEILREEEVVIQGGMYARNFDELPRIFENYDVVLSGDDAEIYDRLMDEFEKNEAEEE